MSTKNELAVQATKTLKTALTQAMGSISSVAARHITPERLLKVALAATQRQPLLLECTPNSIVRVVVGCAEIGLEPNALGHAYMVPFRNNGRYEAQLIIGYRGLIQLAYRSGLIETIAAECVYEGDDFEYDLGTGYVSHRTSGEINPAKITHAYAIVTMKGGGRIVKVMHRKAIDAVRATSKASGSGPWVQHYAEMARKTVLRNLLKYAPMSIEMTKAEVVDAAADAGDALQLGDLDWIDVEDETPPTKGTESLKSKIAPVEEEQATLEEAQVD